MTSPDFSTLLHRAQEARRTGVRGRYAPSPTGALHLGNLRTALFAWLQARKEDGAFVLRMEDIDQPRVQEGSAEEILADLKWLGLSWDEGPDKGGPFGPYVQSERLRIYEEALQLLHDQDLLFRCYCSRRDVREAASAPHGPGGVVYPGTCRDLTTDDRRRLQAQRPDRNPSLRFIVPDQRVAFLDQVAGDYAEVPARDVGDFVVRRSDSLFAYQLVVVVDDALMGISDVVRGADLLTSTPRQIALFDAFGLSPPRFWHAPLMLDPQGDRMSKRDGSDSLALLRDQGYKPADVIGLLASSLGWVDEGSQLSAEELFEEITLDDLRAPSARPAHSTRSEKS